MSAQKLVRVKSKSKATKVLQGPKFRSVGHVCLGQFFFNQAEKYKDNICQISALEDKSETYGSVKLRTIRLALELEKKGIRSKDVIAVCSDNTMDNIIPVISALYVGAKVVNIDHTMNNRQMKYLMNLVAPAIIFVEESVYSLIKETIKESNLKTEIMILGQQLKPYRDENMFSPSKVDVHETAILFFSSGISGAPRAACHSHYSIHQLVQTVVNSGLVTPNILHSTSFCWITIMIILLCVFMNGSTRLFIRDINDGQKIFKIIDQYKITSLFMAPFQIQILLNPELKADCDISSLKHIILAGTPVRKSHLKSLQEIFDQAKIIFNYGLTEVGMITTFNPSTDEQLILNKIGSCGKVAPETKIKVVDLDTEECLGANEKGEIRVKSLGLMKGYHSLDCSEFFDSDGFLKTGDVGYFDEDECFYILDRLKEIFKYKGHYIVPSHIESILLEHPAVKAAGVFGLPSRDVGEVPAACVVLMENYYASEEDLEAYVTSRVLDEERLRGGVKFVSTIPKTSMGRCVRRDLKAMFLETRPESDLSLITEKGL